MLPLTLLLLALPSAAQTGLVTPGGHWKTYYSFFGPGPDTGFGSFTANIGDVDLDGYNDLAISAPGVSYAPSGRGRIYVHSGRDGQQLYITPTGTGFIGICIEPMGDVNGDGYPDFLAGAPAHHFDWLGLAVLYSGKDGQIIRSHLGNGGTYGTHLENLQDLNNDGVSEYAVGAELEQIAPDYCGAVYIYDGASGNLLHKLTGTLRGFIFGSGITSLGDQDSDGIPEYGIRNALRIEVYSGRTGAHLWNLSDSDWEFSPRFINFGDLDKDGFDDMAAICWSDSQTNFRKQTRIYSVQTGELLRNFSPPRQEKLGYGTGLNKVGDINRDGVQDFIVGNITDFWDWQSFETGAAYVLSGMDGEILGRFEGKRTHEWYGWDCTVLGDLDDDGIPEVAASALYGGAFLEGLVQIWSLKPYITADRYKISAQRGGTIEFEIDFPDTQAFQSYAILASTERIGSFDLYGLEVPLPETWLTEFMLSGGRPTGFIGAKGQLDYRGRASATYSTAPGTLLPLLGHYLALSVISFTPPTTTQEASIPIWIYVHP